MPNDTQVMGRRKLVLSKVVKEYKSNNEESNLKVNSKLMIKVIGLDNIKAICSGARIYSCICMVVKLV